MTKKTEETSVQPNPKQILIARIALFGALFVLICIFSIPFLQMKLMPAATQSPTAKPLITTPRELMERLAQRHMRAREQLVAKLPPDERALYDQLVTITDRQLANILQNVGSGSMDAGMVANYLLSRFGPEAIQNPHVLGRYRDGTIKPLGSKELQKMRISFKGASYEIAYEDGCIRLNAALAKAGSANRLLFFFREPHPFLIFGPVTTPAPDYWIFGEELVQSPALEEVHGSSLATKDLVQVRSSLSEMLVAGIAYSVFDPALTQQMTAAAQTDGASYTTLLREVLDKYGIQSLDDMLDDAKLGPLVADANRLVTMHERGHLELRRRACPILYQLMAYEDGGLQSLVEMTVDCAPSGVVQTLARLAQDPGSRAEAQRLLLLELAKHETNRLLYEVMAAESGGYRPNDIYQQENELTAYILLEYLETDPSGWMALVAKANRLYQLLSNELICTLPEKLLKREGINRILPAKNYRAAASSIGQKQKSYVALWLRHALPILDAWNTNRLTRDQVLTRLWNDQWTGRARALEASAKVTALNLFEGLDAKRANALLQWYRASDGLLVNLSINPYLDTKRAALFKQ